MENMFSLKGKIALVTGASYGIGFAIAKAFAIAKPIPYDAPVTSAILPFKLNIFFTSYNKSFVWIWSISVNSWFSPHIAQMNE